jgi:DNA polymerase III epsilon subunit-like protein
MRDTFLKSVCVLDTETTHLIPEKAEIVELAAARYNGSEWQVSSSFFGAKNGIPPEASAKNHISHRMIAGLPTFVDDVERAKEIMHWKDAKYFVAHNCSYDQAVLSTAFISASCNADVIKTQDTARWICTHRLAKQLMPHDFKDMQYNLSFLRYKLDLPVPDEMPAHRADADTFICAVLFEFLVDYAIAKNLVDDTNNLGEEIHRLCWKPFTVTAWPFGKNKGKAFKEIPTDYYMWALGNLSCLDEKHKDFDRDLAENVRVELESRLTA